VQLYTVRRQLETDRKDTLNRIAALGYRNVELFDAVSKVSEYEALLDAAGLTVPSMHARMTDLDEAREAFVVAQRLGVKVVIDPMIEPKRWTTPAGVLAVADQLNLLVAPAAEHGIQIGYHNHWWELQHSFGGSPALALFADNLDAGVLLEVDTYWAQVGGADVVELLHHLGERVQFIHVKDGAGTLDPLEQTAVGAGRLDVLAILDAAPQALRVVELDDYPGDIFDALAASFSYLTGQGVTA
jgi:sugar phosphate isomerase/epimerase